MIVTYVWAYSFSILKLRWLNVEGTCYADVALPMVIASACGSPACCSILLCLVLSLSSNSLPVAFSLVPAYWHALCWPSPVCISRTRMHFVAQNFTHELSLNLSLIIRFYTHVVGGERLWYDMTRHRLLLRSSTWCLLRTYGSTFFKWQSWPLFWIFWFCRGPLVQQLWQWPTYIPPHLQKKKRCLAPAVPPMKA